VAFCHILYEINYAYYSLTLGQKMLDSVPVRHLPDICASLVKASYVEKMQILDAVDISDRFKRTLPLLLRQIEVCVSLCPSCLSIW